MVGRRRARKDLGQAVQELQGRETQGAAAGQVGPREEERIWFGSIGACVGPNSVKQPIHQGQLVVRPPSARL
jgi:hypothetical protein